MDENQAMSKSEIARFCGFGSANYFFNVYLPKNYPDLLCKITDLGYKKDMRILSPKIVQAILKEFV